MQNTGIVSPTFIGTASLISKGIRNATATLLNGANILIDEDHKHINTYIMIQSDLHQSFEDCIHLPL